MLRLDLGQVHVAAEPDPEGLPGQVVVELSLAILLPGGLQLGRNHVPRQHVHHHRGQGIGQQLDGLAGFQVEAGLLVGFHLQATACLRDDLGEQTIQLGHGGISPASKDATGHSLQGSG